MFSFPSALPSSRTDFRTTFRKSLLVSSLFLISMAAARPLVVSSKLDTEAQLLGQIILQVSKATGLSVSDKTALGDTGVNRKAILAGEIDIYPEYTGNAVYLFPEAKISAAQATRPKEIYELARKLDAAQGITWLAPASINNTWAVAVPRSLANKHKLNSMVDLAKYINTGGTFKLAGSPEFFNRPDAWPAFEKVYGFSLKSSQKVVLAGATPIQTQQAAARKQGGVNAGMAYSTDATLVPLDLIALTDPKHAQAVYQPAPIIRTSLLKEYPQLKVPLEKAFATLDNATIQGLAAQVIVEGKTPAVVVRQYLISKGLIR